MDSGRGCGERLGFHRGLYEVQVRSFIKRFLWLLLTMPFLFLVRNRCPCKHADGAMYRDNLLPLLFPQQDD